MEGITGMSLPSLEPRLLLYLNTRSLPLERDTEIEAASRLGLQLVVATPDRAGLEKYHLKHVLEVPVGNYDLAQRIILQYIHDHALQIQGVVCWSDKEVELVARLGEALGLPCTTTRAAQNVRNKIAFRQMLQQIPGLNPRYSTFSDENSFISALEYVGVPALLKPAGASGGRGIWRIHSLAEAREQYRRFRASTSPERDEVFSYFAGEYLLEEELLGSEHSIAGIVTDGVIHTFAITEKRIDPRTHIQYQNIVPARLPVESIKAIISTTEAVIKATTLNWCGFHMDFMLTEQGIKVLEVGGRYGGECINSHLIPLSIEGLNPYQELLRTVQGLPSTLRKDYSLTPSRRAAMQMIFPQQFGRIVAVKGLDKVKAHPHVKAFLQLRNVGDYTYHPAERYNSFAVAHVIVQTELHENIEEILAEIASSVSIEVAEIPVPVMEQV